MKLSKDQQKQLRQIGHQLKPVVTVGDKGLSETVVMELNRALNDHELIKIKVAHEDRKSMVDKLSEDIDLTIVQTIGNIVLAYRASEKPNPKLSNVLRFS